MEKTLTEKILTILNAHKNGMSRKQIDPIGYGSSLTTLLKGGKPTDRKIEEMHANVLVYQDKENQRNQFKLKVNVGANLSRAEKEQILLEAMANGIAKSKLDPKCQGASATRLQQGGRVQQAKINAMYNNLLAVLGYPTEQAQSEQTQTKSIPSPEPHLPETVRTLKIMVASLCEQISALKTKVQTLETQHQSLLHLPQPKGKTRKILGVTVVQKTDKIRGKAYKRWYGSHKVNGKRRWIYIGNDLSLAQERIGAALRKGQA